MLCQNLLGDFATDDEHTLEQIYQTVGKLVQIHVEGTLHCKRFQNVLIENPILTNADNTIGEILLQTFHSFDAHTNAQIHVAIGCVAAALDMPDDHGTSVDIGNATL